MEEKYNDWEKLKLSKLYTVMCSAQGQITPHL